MLNMESAKDVVLLVDDEPQVLMALEDILADEFVVIKAQSGQQALNVVENEPGLAVVVTDQRMPRMSGDELISKLADRTAAARIMVTGYADLSAVIRAVNEGRLFAYVAKPWEPDDLRLKVTQAAEHYRLSRELLEERQLLHDLMDNIPDGIYFKDQDLRFRRANRAFGTLYGTTPANVLNKRSSDLVEQSSDSESVELAERQLLAGGPTIIDATRMLRVGGQERWISESKATVSSGSASVGAGAVIGMVGVVRDITERRAEEERAQVLARLRSASSAINAALPRAGSVEALLDETCRLLVTLGGLAVACVVQNQTAGGTRVVCSAAADNAERALVGKLAEWVAEAYVTDSSTTEANITDSSVAAADSPKAAVPAVAPAPTLLDDVRQASTFAAQPLLLERGIQSLGAFAVRTREARWSIVLGASLPEFFGAERLQLLLETFGHLSLALAHIGKSQQVEFLSHHDPLTGLPNRPLFLARVEQQLAVHQRNDLRLALLLVDLGRFRQLNDALGRAGGDQVLIQVSSRLLAMDQVSIVARFAGNVFALLCPAMESEAAVAALVEGTLSAALHDPFMVDGTEVRVSFATGIAVFPSDADRADALVSNAEAALRKAKASLQPYLFYAPTMNARVAEQLTLETKLRRAIEMDEFVLHYQPKVELRTGQVVGLEALIRWNDPVTGLVPPGKFIPVLEETGLIREVGNWVMERAAHQYNEWQLGGAESPRIAVNVSALQLASSDFVARLGRVLQAHPERGPGIDLEITESVFVDDLAGSIDKLRAARECGMAVVIDDFGTGYSSLSYLSRLPIDGLKIDRSFVERMVEEPQSTAIVTTIISLAHALDLKVVAEGVETVQQAQFLRLLRCDQIQGYLFSKPLPAEGIPELLTRRFNPSTMPQK